MKNVYDTAGFRNKSRVTANIARVYTVPRGSNSSNISCTRTGHKMDYFERHFTNVYIRVCHTIHIRNCVKNLRLPV